MKINLANLYNMNRLDLDTTVEFTNIDTKLIKKLENVKIKGYFKYTLSEEIEINLHVSGTMYLNDAITLDEISHDFAFDIAEIYNEGDENFAKLTKNNQNILDINELLWENIVLEVPISKTLNSGLKMQGKGWELNS